jgi:hypothetical protein
VFQLLAGGVPGLKWWWGESKKSKKSNKPFNPPGMYENHRFPELFALKIAENAVFLLKGT